MRIGLNLLYLLPGTVGGTETYAANLIHKLEQVDQSHEFLVFVNREAAEWPLPRSSRFNRIVCPVSGASRVRRYFYEQTHFPRLLKRYNLDLLHSLGYVAPLFPPCPSVVTIHDLNFLRLKEYMSVVRRLGLGLLTRMSAQRACRVITGSEFSRNEVVTALGLPAGQVQTIHNGDQKEDRVIPSHEDSLNALKRFGIEPPYLLALSSHSPHKNMARLLRSFEQARSKRGLEHRLVLAGHVPPGGTLDALVQSLALNNSVIVTGYLDSADLQAILANACALVFPSLYEGFGLPVIEAMSLGVPVICSNHASLPEVAGDAAVYFDPLCVDEMARTMAEVASDDVLLKRLREKGFDNIQRFDWSKAATETLAVYEAVASAA